MKESPKEKEKYGFNQLIKTLELSEQELKDRVKVYLQKCPDLLYKGDIVTKDKKASTRENGYLTTDTKKPFCEIITNILLKEKLNIQKIDEQNATYNLGSRKEKIENLSSNFDENLKYCTNEKGKVSETKLVHCLCKQKNFADYTAVDFQIPTKNSGKDNIDFLLKDINNYFYMVEVKTFNSDESLLRCVLEIETYFRKINNNFYSRYKILNDENNQYKLKKAVMFDKDSFAFENLSTSWGQSLIKYFEITVFLLSKAKNKFVIEKFK